VNERQTSYEEEKEKNTRKEMTWCWSTRYESLELNPFIERIARQEITTLLRKCFLLRKFANITAWMETIFGCKLIHRQTGEKMQMFCSFSCVLSFLLNPNPAMSSQFLTTHTPWLEDDDDLTDCHWTHERLGVNPCQ